MNDGSEDLDFDGLTNLQEYNLGTNPNNDDSDGDGLTDGEEVNTYNTDPMNVDTDGDGLSDYDEVKLGLNPVLPDTNGNGVLDCDEKFLQTITNKIECEEKPAVTDVTVSFEGSGNIESTTTIDNIYNIDMNSSGVVGLIGAPVEITTTSEFVEAVITFAYDESLLGDTLEENLAVMWYDEENGQFIILDQNSVVDTVNNTVSYTTTHFSKYMLVDSQEWYDCWRTNIDFREGSSYSTYYDFMFVVDTSGSMNGNSMYYAKTAMNNFIDCLSDKDHAGLVQFDSKASVVCPMGSPKDTLKSGVNSLYANGGTRVSQGLSAGINQLLSYNTGNKKAVILICDGDVDSVDSIVETAYQHSIPIYTVNVISSNSYKLESIASRTGGEYYYASNSSDLVDKMEDLCGGTLYDLDLTDSDGDGLPDTFEINGMRLSNGQIIYTDPFNPDTDNDGILDGVEIGNICFGNGMQIENLNLNVVVLPDGGFYIGDGESTNSIIFFNAISYPTIKELSLAEKDSLYLSEEELRKVIALQYVIYLTLDDEYICNNLCDEVTRIRMNCKYSEKYTDEELTLLSNAKTTKVEWTGNNQFTEESILQMHRNDSIIIGAVGFFGSLGTVLSMLMIISSTIEQNDCVDLLSLGLALGTLAPDKRISTFCIWAGVGVTTWGVANEGRITYRVSDGFVVQDGDACLEFKLSYDLGKVNESYHMYFRDGKLEYIREYSSQGSSHGSFPGYDRIIANKWINEGYISRNEWN